MAPPTSTADLESLLAHAGWMRSLARRLVRDPELAEDLVQETWLAALERRPSEGGSIRAWLAAVARNLARQMRRADARRSAREDACRRPDARDSTLDVVARASGERELVAALLALDEPYRTTVLLRFFDGLPPRAIAARRGIPVATVKTHLARGLERLRRALDRERGGERGAWLAIVLPLAGSSGAHGIWLGGWIVDTKAKLGAALVVAAGAIGGLVALRALDAPAALEPGASEAPSDALAAEPEARPAQAAEPTRALEREALAAEPAAPRAASAKPANEAAPAARLTGLVLDAEGEPLAGVALAFVPADEPLAEAASATQPALRSGAGGRFEADAPARAGFVVASDLSRATVLAGGFHPGASVPPTVVVAAPRAPLAGRVTDEAGAPIEGVAIEWLLPEGFRARFDAVLDGSSPRGFGTESDAQGFFELADAPGVRGARLAARAEGFEPWNAEAPERGDSNLAIVLRRPAAAASTLYGRVIDAAGEPVEGARVALGVDTTRSDALGRFAFDLGDEHSFSAQMGVPRERVIAVKRGQLPASLDAPARDADGKPRWPAEVVLRLGAEPLAIAGRVLHRDGSAAVGLDVWIADPTALGPVDGAPAFVENLLAGASGDPWRRVQTDDAGRFRIDGLCARDYAVETMDSRTLLRASAPAVAAGEEALELVLPEDQLFERVAGRVVSRAGAPISNAHVFPMCDAFRLQLGGRSIGTRHATAEGVATDADGRFELRDVPKSLVYLRIDGDETLPVEYGRFEEGGITELARGRMTELEIVVPLRCHVKVELPDGDPATSLTVLDAAGRRLTLNVIEANSRRETEALELSEGRSTPFAVSDEATTLVLLQGDEELARIPLALVPGELNVVRP